MKFHGCLYQELYLIQESSILSYLFYEISSLLFFFGPLFPIIQIFQMQLGWRSASKDQQSHIDQIHELAKRMKVAGYTINQQLQKQQNRLETFHQEMQITQGRLGSLQKQIGDLLQTHDVNQVCTCMMLCCFMIVLIILVIIF